jgi:uncharacterized protein DUF6459
LSTSPTPLPSRDDGVRRPPAGAAHRATVTKLGLGAQTGPQPVPVSSVQGTLALDLAASAGMPRTPELRLVTGGRAAPEDVQLWAARFAQATVEVLGGDRPLPQLLRWTSQRVYADLGRRVSILGRSSVVTQRLRTVRPQVRSVHVFQPTPQSAEVSVHVRHGRRSRAIAARLELESGRWQCTALQLG